MKSLNPSPSGGNRFKFLPFHTRLAHLSANPTHTQTFHQLLTTLPEQNLTAQFTQLHRAIEPLATTLTEQLLNKHEIGRKLADGLGGRDNLAIKEICQLIHAHVSDLGADLLTPIPLPNSDGEQTNCIAILANALTLMLKTNAMDPEAIEAGYSTLAAMYKILAKPLQSRILFAFEMMLPLITDEHKHVRRFSGPTFAYLLRRTEEGQLKKWMHYMLSEVKRRNHVAYTETMCGIVLETVKQVGHAFHSKTTAIVLDIIAQQIGIHPSLDMFARELLLMMFNHGRKETVEPLWDWICNLLRQYEEDENKETLDTKVEIALGIVLDAIALRNGSRFPVSSLLLQGVLVDISAICSHTSVPRILLQVLALTTTQLEKKEAETFLEAVYAVLEPKNILLLGANLLDFQWPYFTECMMPQCSSSIIKSKSCSETTAFIGRLIAAEISDLDQLQVSPQLKAELLQKLLQFPMANGVTEWLTVLKILTRTKVCEDCMPVVSKTLAKGTLLEHCSTIEGGDQMLAEIISAGSTILETDELIQHLSSLHQLLKQSSESIPLLSSCADLLKLPKRSQQLLKIDTFENWVNILQANFSSRNPAVRLNSIDLLLGLESNEEIKMVLGLMRASEELPPSFEQVRAKLIPIRKLELRLRDRTIGRTLSMIVTNWAVSLVSTHNEEVIKTGMHLVQTLFRSAESTMWDVIWSHVLKIEDNRLMYDHHMSSQNIAADKQHTSMLFIQDHNVLRLRSAKSEHETDKDPSFVNTENLWAFYAQLMKTLQESPRIAEKHAVTLVPHFFSKAAAGNVEDDDGPHFSQTAIRHYLNVFRNFADPSKIAESTQLVQFYKISLMRPDTLLQQLALQCLFTYKSAALTTQKAMLERLVADATSRDELIRLSGALRDGSIPTEHLEELMEIILRMLYGKVITRKNKAAGGNSAGVIKARQSSIFTFIAACRPQDLKALLDLATSSLSVLVERCQTIDDRFYLPSAVEDIRAVIPIRIMKGFITTLDEMFSQLPKLLQPHVQTLLGVTMQIHHVAQASLEVTAEGKEKIRLKDLRSMSFKIYQDFFVQEYDFDYAPYMPAMFAQLIQPRLELLASENSQGPSSLLELCKIWSSMSHHVHLLQSYDVNLLEQIVKILEFSNAVDKAVCIVFDIIENLINMTLGPKLSSSTAVANEMLNSNVDVILRCTGSFLLHNRTASPNKSRLINRAISLISIVSERTERPDQMRDVVDTLIPSLRKGVRVVSDTVKADILRILRNSLPSIIASTHDNPQSSDNYRSTICQLFSTLSDSSCRTILVDIVAVFETLSAVHGVVSAINAMEPKRINEADYGARCEALERFVDSEMELSDPQWLLILHNCVFLMNDHEDMVQRKTAAGVVHKYMQSSHASNAEGGPAQHVLHVLLPAIKKAMHSPHQSIRAEYLALLARCVELFPASETFSDMTILLAAGDEEAAFFTNVLHLKSHRRQRALVRFGKLCEVNSFRSSTLQNIFLPLLSHFIFSEATSKRQDDINEAINAISSIASTLLWKPYYDTIKMYMRALSKKPNLAKTIIRLLISLLGNWRAEQADENSEIVGLCEMIYGIMEKKDDKERSDDQAIMRLPLATAIVKLLLTLKEDSMQLQLPRVLSIICVSLQSRNQLVRDAGRSTLVETAVLLGPSYARHIITTMQTKLDRGFQLHVLGYALNSVLAKITATCETGALDYCLDDIMRIVVEELVGKVGQEKDSEEMTGKVREAKSDKAFDTFELIGQTVLLENISKVLGPIRDIVDNTANSKQAHKVSESLRRLGLGLHKNKGVDHVDYLVFIYSLIINQVEANEPDHAEEQESTATNFIVQNLKRPDQVAAPISKQYSQHFVNFGFNIFLMLIRSDGFDPIKYKEALDPFVYVATEGLNSRQAQIMIQAAKALILLSKYDLPQLRSSLPVAVKRAIKYIRKEPSTSTELAQTLFRFLTCVMRDNPYVKVERVDIKPLLALISPDLEDASKQNMVFSFFKAVIGRKIITTEVYELMDQVADILVTAQSQQIRELCRQTFIGYLLNYEINMDLLTRHLRHLMENLTYVHASGRASVLMMFKLILDRFPTQTINTFIDLLFMNVLLRVHNEEDKDCQALCKDLAAQIMLNADTAKQYALIQVIATLKDSDQTEHRIVAARAYSIAVQADVSPIIRAEEQLLVTIDSALGRSETQEKIEWLELLKTMHTQIRTLNSSKSMQRLWPKIIDLTVDADFTLQPICLGNLAIHLASNADMEAMENEPTLPKETCRNLCIRFFDNLRESRISATVKDLTLVNLIHISRIILKRTSLQEDSDLEVSDAEEIDEAKTSSINRNAQVFWLFRKMSMICRQSLQAATKSICFQWMSAMIDNMTRQEVLPYVIPILSPIYRTTEDTSNHDTDFETTQELARNLAEKLQKLIGDRAYLSSLGAIRNSISSIRQKRRALRDTCTITDPAAAARRKLQKNAMKIRSRKRKADDFRQSKGKKIKPAV